MTAIADQLDMFGGPPRELHGCVTPAAHAWRRAQGSFDKRLTSAFLAGRCREVGSIRQERRDFVKSLLAQAVGRANARNIGGPRVDNSSGYVGVSADGARWRAWIRVENRLVHLGTFDTAELARDVRLVAERHYWGTQPRRASAISEVAHEAE